MIKKRKIGLVGSCLSSFLAPFFPLSLHKYGRFILFCTVDIVLDHSTIHTSLCYYTIFVTGNRSKMLTHGVVAKNTNQSWNRLAAYRIASYSVA